MAKRYLVGDVVRVIDPEARPMYRDLVGTVVGRTLETVCVLRFEKFTWTVQFNDSALISEQTLKDVEREYGPDTTKLLKSALGKGRFDEDDWKLIDETKEDNEPLKPLKSWNKDDSHDAALYFIREIEIDYGLYLR